MKKTMFKFSVLCAFFYFQALPTRLAQAGALFYIEGTLVSFTHDQYLISRNHVIYYIKRSAMNAQQRKMLQNTGDQVEVAVHPSDITLVKDEKK